MGKPAAAADFIRPRGGGAGICSDIRSYQAEAERLRSFEFWHWPVKFISPIDLAKAGFYFKGYGDSVRCAFCGIVLCRWERGDVPLAEHAKHNPKCIFLLDPKYNPNLLHEFSATTHSAKRTGAGAVER